MHRNSYSIQHMPEWGLALRPDHRSLVFILMVFDLLEMTIKQAAQTLMMMQIPLFGKTVYIEQSQN